VKHNTVKRPKRPEIISLFIGGERKTQPPIWRACVDYALKEHAEKSAAMFDNKWLGSANKMSLEWLYKRVRETIEETAVHHYRYWHMRVHSPGAYGRSVDPAMAQDWIAAGGKIEKML
jgi:hypothetical protein